MVSLEKYPFRSLKSKKARYGFQMDGPRSISQIMIAAEVIKHVRKISPDDENRIEYGINYGAATFKMYTDNDILAALMEREYCWNTQPDLI